MTENESYLIHRVLTSEQIKVAIFLKEKVFSKLPDNHFFLVGGTAIALQYGHRMSIDFDFFSFRSEMPNDILTLNLVEKILKQEGIFQRQDIESNEPTKHFLINGVGITFLFFQNPHADVYQDYWNIPQKATLKNALGFPTLSIQDLAGMKLFARCKRKKLKDIVDISEILHHLSLSEVIEIAKKQFHHHISEKDIINKLLNLDDVKSNVLDEPIYFLNDRDSAYYENHLKQQCHQLYHANI